MTQIRKADNFDRKIGIYMYTHIPHIWIYTRVHTHPFIHACTHIHKCMHLCACTHMDNMYHKHELMWIHPHPHHCAHGVSWRGPSLLGKKQMTIFPQGVCYSALFFWLHALTPNVNDFLCSNPQSRGLGEGWESVVRISRAMREWAKGERGGVM